MNTAASESEPENLAQVESLCRDLFGQDLLVLARALPVLMTSIQFMRVGYWAGKLRESTGNPQAQRQLVEAMPPQYRILLCRSLVDPDYFRACATRLARLGRQ